LTDYAHKIISPKTYQCHLCALTYGNLGINNAWKDFIKSLGAKVEFLHKDEFVKKHNFKTSYPVILKESRGKLLVLISTKELNSFKSLEELMKSIKTKLLSESRQ